MKKILLIVLSMLLVVLPLAACGGGGSSDTNSATNTETETSTETNTETSTKTETGTNTTTQTNTTTNTTTSTNTNTNTNTSTQKPDVPAPTPDSTYVSPTVEESLKNELGVFDKDDDLGIGGTMSDYKTETIVDVSKVASNDKYLITTAGQYRLTGTSADGQIYVKTKAGNVVLVLDNLSLTCKSFAAPAIYVEGCSSVTIVLVGDNYLSDNTTNDGEGAVIRVRSSGVTFDGKGTLTIDAKAKHGISNTKQITINGGTYNITAPNQGIYGKLGLEINGGQFNVDAGKSALKSGDDEDGAVGYININSGSYNLTAATNGLSCNGPVTINGCRMNVNAINGNAIEATNNISINGGTMMLESYKSAISSDANIEITGNTNIKINTTGNGISGYDVDISTTGVIYVKTTPTYEPVTSTTSPTEKTYVFVNGKFTLFDPTVHPVNSTQYVCRNCRGIAADNFMIIRNGVIGLDTYQDSINTESFVLLGGRLVLNTTNDAIDATDAIIYDGANVVVLASDKGIKANTLVIDGGQISIISETDAIKSDDATINGGTIYLFDKIDVGEGTVTVNGGTILMISTTNNRQTTMGTANFFSKIVANKDKAVGGKWIRVTCGDDMIILELPKNYTEKMAIYYTSDDMNGTVFVSIGTLTEEQVFVWEITE